MKYIFSVMMIMILIASAVAGAPDNMTQGGQGNEDTGENAPVATLMQDVTPTLAGVGNASGGNQQGSGEEVSAQVQNQGEESQIEEQTRVRSGEYTSENGQQLRVEEQSNNHEFNINTLEVSVEYV